MECSGRANRSSNYLSRPDQLLQLINTKKGELCPSDTAAPESAAPEAAAPEAAAPEAEPAAPEAVAPETPRPGVSSENVRSCFAAEVALSCLLIAAYSGCNRQYAMPGRFSFKSEHQF